MSLIAHRPGRWIDPRSGGEIGHGDLLHRMATKQAVMLGETHSRYDVHRWQLHVTAGLHALRPDLAVGFEMFPRRVQPVLDAWVAGELGVEAFLEKVEWKMVWNFPPELYLPLFHFCRQFRVPMLALNCRRALVTEVGKVGWDAIPIEDRDGVTPAKAFAMCKTHISQLCFRCTMRCFCVPSFLKKPNTLSGLSGGGLILIKQERGQAWWLLARMSIYLNSVCPLRLTAC